jgi:hypothetical protein
MRTGNWLYLFYLIMPFKCISHLIWEMVTCWYWVRRWPWPVKMGFDDASSCFEMQSAAYATAYQFTAKNGQAKWKTCCPPLKGSFINRVVVFIVTLLRFFNGVKRSVWSSLTTAVSIPSYGEDILQYPNTCVNQKPQLERRLIKRFCFGTRLQLNWTKLWNYYRMQRDVMQSEKNLQTLRKKLLPPPQSHSERRKKSLNLT